MPTTVFQRLFLLILFSLVLPGQPSWAQEVKTSFARNYNFAGLKTFAWKKNHLVTMRHPEDNKILDLKIMRAVTAELAAKGFEEESAHPDFYLFYHAGPGDEGLQAGVAPPAGLESIQPPDKGPGNSNMWNVGAGTNAGFAPNVWYSVQGKFVFYVLDSRTSLVVWAGTATKKWSDPQKARKNEDKEIKQIATKSFRDFPPRTKK